MSDEAGLCRPGEDERPMRRLGEAPSSIRGLRGGEGSSVDAGAGEVVGAVASARCESFWSVLGEVFLPSPSSFFPLAKIPSSAGDLFSFTIGVVDAVEVGC